MSAIFDSTKTVFLPSNTGGVMVQVAAATPADNIFVFASDTYKFKWIGNVRGEYPLSQAKILANDVTDKSSVIQSILDHEDVKTIILDAQQSVVISGTIDCKGKTIKFAPGSKFIGTAILYNAVIDADYQQQIFNTSISLSSCNLAGDRMSVMWYGAVNDDTEDAAPAIQKTIDTAIANQSIFVTPDNIKSIYIPAGSYLLNSPVIVYKWNGVRYDQCTVNIIGDYDYAGTYPNGTRLNCNFRDTFAIGIQQGKSCKVEGIMFQGQFTPPALGTGYSWYSLNFEQFNDGLSRDSQYSPYSAIVIDPFTNGGVPADTGYPNLTSWYRGLGGQGGSTGVYIRNCLMTNFVIGVITSPNGVTRNAELTFVERCQFANMKICISGCQDQEKANKVYDLMCWSNTHTIFATGLYGAQVPGNWYVEIVNVAGAVNQLVYNNGLGYYPCYFEKVFAESIGKIGFLGTDLQSSFKDSVIDLQRFGPGSEYEIGLYDWAITGYNTLFENCVIRYYGTASPVSIMGRMVFRNCYFEEPPYCPSGVLTDNMPFNIDKYGPSVFQNCTYNSAQFDDTQDSIAWVNAIFDYLVYGKKKWIEKIAYRVGTWSELEIDGGESCTYEYWAATFNLDPVTVTVNANRQAVINVTAAHINKFSINRPVICHSSGYLMGICTNVNTSTNDIIVSYIPPAISNGTFYIGCVHAKRFKAAFIGDFTASSPVITNVVPDDWGDAGTIAGAIVEVPQIINFAFIGKYQNLARVLSYDSGARTITLDVPANVSMTGRYFTTGNIVKNLISYNDAPIQAAFANTIILPFGSKVLMGQSQYLVTKTGFVNAATIGGGETRQAQWIKLGQEPQEFADDASADLMGVRMYYNTTSSIVKIKNGATWFEVATV